MGRKPKGEKAMTGAERQRKHREKTKLPEPTHPLVELRRKLWREIEHHRAMYPDEPYEYVAAQLDELEYVWSLTQYTLANGGWSSRPWRASYTHDFLTGRDVSTDRSLQDRLVEIDQKRSAPVAEPTGAEVKEFMGAA